MLSVTSVLDSLMDAILSAFTIYPPPISYVIVSCYLIHTLSRTLSCFSFALSKPASSLEAGARRQLVGGPVLQAGGGLGQRFSGQSGDTSAHGLFP